MPSPDPVRRRTTRLARRADRSMPGVTGGEQPAADPHRALVDVGLDASEPNLIMAIELERNLGIMLARSSIGAREPWRRGVIVERGSDQGEAAHKLPGTRIRIEIHARRIQL